MTPGKTVEVARSEARLYLAKAEQFAEEARVALQDSRNDAAMLNAVHTAISAVDAVSVALAGRRSADPDHRRAADLLQEIGGMSTGISTHVKQLRMLLARKNVVEYESRQATNKEATDAVKRAERLYLWARGVVLAANL